MSGRIETTSEWNRARFRHAQEGRAPRLAGCRAILLRQSASGAWTAAIIERQFGAWGKPTWLSGIVSFYDARRAALAAWRKPGLPVLWAYAGECDGRLFHQGGNEPKAVRS